MANRDIQLIIKAKNQATKTIDSVNDALSALTVAQDKVAGSAAKTDAALANVTDELERLKNGTKAVEGLKKAEAIMDVAANAVNRLEQELTEARAKLEAVGQQASAASTRIEELTAANEKLLSRQKQQKADMEAARKATIQTSDAVRELAKAERAYASAQKLKPDAKGRDDSIAKAKERLDAARAAVEQNNQAYQKQKVIVAATNDELKRNAQELSAVRKSHKAFKDDTESLNVAIKQQEVALENGRSEFAQITTSVDLARTAIKNLGISTTDTSADAGRLTAEIERLGAVMKNIARYSTGNGGFASSDIAASLRKQYEAVDAAKTSWKELEAEAKRLAGQINSTSGNVTQLVDRFNQVTAAARQAKNEFQGLNSRVNFIGPVMPDNIASKRGMARETDAAAGAMTRLSTASGKARVGLMGVNHESRQAMSVMQRVRGEVLSLVTAYVGLFGLIQGAGGVIAAYQQMEAAQNRLGVVFQQNGEKVRTEMAWLQAEASRLGIQFGTLSDQYSKFAVAADAAGFSTSATRDVFTALAEAGRVNKLSLEDMNGAFLALTQMISKGKISSEELRQQLGERLPGAMNIMADALDVTTSELYKMLEQGEVLADSKTMLKFADELNRRFGPQLQSSLASTSAQIGKFWNNVFQAQMQVADGGFIEGFNQLLADMNSWFQSKEGHEFFLGLGAAAGRLADALTFVVQNIDLFGYKLQFLISIKAAAWLYGIVAHLADVRANLATTTTQTTITTGSFTALWGKIVALSATMRAQFVGAVAMAGGALTTFNIKLLTARAGSIALTAGLWTINAGIRALNIALAAMGGPLGLLITLGSIIATPLIVGWATGVDDATASLDEHRRIMQAVLGQYDKVKNKTDAWGDSIENVTLTEVNANLRKMAEAYEAARNSAAFKAANTTAFDISWAGGIDAEASKYTKLLRELGNNFLSGKITAQEYRQELERFNRETSSDDVRIYIESLTESARAAEEAGGNFSTAAEVAQKFGSTLVDLVAEGLGATTERLKDTAEAQDEANGGFDAGTKSLDAYTEAMGRLAEKIPGLSAEMKKLSDLAKIEADFQAAISAIDESNFRTASRLYADAVARRDAAIAATNDQYTDFESQYAAGRGTPQGAQLEELVTATTLLAEQIGVSAKDLLTVMSFETAGTFDPWKAGPTTQWGQHRGLIQWGEPQREKYGVTVESSISEQVAAAGKYLLDAGVKPGDGLTRIYAAILSGNANNVNASDVANGGVVSNVTDSVSGEQFAAHKARAEGLLAAHSGIVKATEEAYEANKRITEELEQQREATEKSLADMGFENEMIQTRMAGKEKEAFIEEQIRALKEQNKNLTAEQEARARELLARQYDLNAALDAERDKKTQIEEIEQRITDLQTQRDALKEQRDFYEESGNTAMVADLDGQIAGVNSELSAAIQNAIALYEVMGGSGADAAIAKAEALKLKINEVGGGIKKTRFSAQEMRDTIFNSLEGGIINMFDAFAQAVANGENAFKAVGQAFRQFAADFLREIAVMILKAALFKALSGWTDGIMGVVSSIIAHSGAVVGQTPGDGSRAVAPAWFAGAARYHTGGIAGLKPNEMPAILEVGEEVLTKNDPRHVSNMGAAGGGGEGKRPRIVNMFDSASFLGEALANIVGEEVILNYVRANPGAWKQALEG